ncbi:MAG: superinfection immunity protein [Roseiarcus sp.]
MHRYVGPFGPGGGLLLLVFYFAPSIIALIRGHLSTAAIFVLNLILGWTFVGWIIALIWSLTGNTARNRDARY